MILVASATLTQGDDLCGRLEIALNQAETLQETYEAIEKAVPAIRASLGEKSPSQELRQHIEIIKAHKKSLGCQDS